MQYSDLGKFIKFKRLQMGISLNKFATEAEIDPAILCRIENLKQGIKINVLESVARVFGMSPAGFLMEFENIKNDL
ncbi:TPA: helix-turn-helix transcriptional regulator [Candidatus Scatousia excrementigallinarum]|uniref:Helix-turn-helix transcriptional regulator n=1 Tax=Candidatus Scatousia excrementigallinarum TaxID=2840935 RepID=A0A9D1F0B4_9BACT|nr:helix-turn-helix transcriptional regulator [Candidatus Scatousia excrementigallinarum]